MNGTCLGRGGSGSETAWCLVLLLQRMEAERRPRGKEDLLINLFAAFLKHSEYEAAIAGRGCRSGAEMPWVQARCSTIKIQNKKKYG